MTSLRSLIRPGHTVTMPGAHDAITARLIEHAGFEAYSIGGSALAATQMALPDIGIQSFGEYRDSIARTTQGSALPFMVDGENGFGDQKAVTRTVRTFEALGVSAMAFEDLTFPPTLGVPPTVIDLDDMTIKLEAAVAAKTNPETMIIGRTDAAAVIGLDEGISRAKHFETLGVDGVLLTGVADHDALKRVRDEISVPIIAIVIESGPWAAATPDELASIGYELAVYPAGVLLGGLSGYRDALERMRSGNVTLPDDNFGHGGLRELLRPDEWAGIDAAAIARTEGKS